MVPRWGDVERVPTGWEDLRVSTPVVDWAAVVPVKGGPLAKSRLALPRAARSGLADAFARDTVAALRTADPRMPVLVVTSDPAVSQWVAVDGGRLVPDPGLGLDAAVEAGCRAGAACGAHSRNTIATESRVVTCLRSSRVNASLHGFRSLQETQQLPCASLMVGDDLVEV